MTDVGPIAPLPPHLNEPGSCGTCYFSESDPNGILYCCKEPPGWQRSVPYSGSPPPPTGSQTHALVPNFPVVRQTDWCGHGYDLTTNKWHTPSGNEPTS